MSDPLTRLLPETARLVAWNASPGDGLDATALRERVERARSSGPQIRRRRVYGVQGENGIDTLIQVFQLMSAGAIPAPFTPDTATSVRDGSLARLGAAGLWSDTNGWSELAGDAVWPDGFELVMHSSGTTGIPKAMGIRLDAFARNAADVAAAAGLSADDRHLGTMAHCYMSGLYNGTLLPLLTGATSIAFPLLTPSRIGAFLETLARHQPTVVWINPLMARMLWRMSAVKREHLACVRLLISCTAPLSRELKVDFEAKFEKPLLQSYGLCETLITTLEDPAEPAPGTVGKPVGSPGAVTVDEGGQVVISNGALFAGYLDREHVGCGVEQVSRFVAPDLGSFDANGNIVITGRTTEVINRYGVKFAPEVVEAVLAGLPGVDDCAVVAILDGKDEVRLVALVVGSAMPADLTHALGAILPPAQRPSHILKRDRIPRTPSGKIDRRRSEQEART